MRACFCRFVGEGTEASAVIASAYAIARAKEKSRVNRDWPGCDDNDLRAARYRDHMARNDRIIVFSDGRVSDPYAEAA